jgi:hypothetical protein
MRNLRGSAPALVGHNETVTEMNTEAAEEQEDEKAEAIRLF